ncbi:lytic transglycosylase domain-containing protein [Nitratireductor sp. GISD-1A_MAKvit]|uniref:transglycosylase SLT domain-containing protein n=1 Tax=Nitratireductor sp. GISD-1A_MAKvit TaxID=3234198 RepID=UPI003465D41F
MPLISRTFAALFVLALPLASGCRTTETDVQARSGLSENGEDADIVANSLVAEQDAQIDSGPISAEAFAGQRPPSAALTALETGAPVRSVAPRSAELDALISQYARFYDVPVQLVRRVVKRESNFNPAARNRIYWGLMQIRHDTAQTMGYRGPASGLLDAETNLKYAVKYLRGAYITAEGNEDRAVRLYARGYYYDAKRKGLLKQTGPSQLTPGLARRRGENCPELRRIPTAPAFRANPDMACDWLAGSVSFPGCREMNGRAIDGAGPSERSEPSMPSVPCKSAADVRED